MFQNEYSVFMYKIKVFTVVNDILQSCSYILTTSNEKGAYIVDCGNVEPLLSYLEKNNLNLDGVLLTHCHYDHIYGLKDLMFEYPNLKVYASSKTFQGINDEDSSMSYLYVDEDYYVNIPEEQKIVIEGCTKLNIFGEKLKCILTPGHDIDCVSYVIGNLIFTGDSYNPQAPVFTKWHNSNVGLALQSENILRNLITTNNLQVFPGHKID